MPIRSSCQYDHHANTIITKAVLLINVAPVEIAGSQEAKSMALKDKCPWDFPAMRKILHLTTTPKETG
jgi:hypothetical protein